MFNRRQTPARFLAATDCGGGAVRHRSGRRAGCSWRHCFRRDPSGRGRGVRVFVEFPWQEGSARRSGQRLRFQRRNGLRSARVVPEWLRGTCDRPIRQCAREARNVARAGGSASVADLRDGRRRRLKHRRLGMRRSGRRAGHLVGKRKRLADARLANDSHRAGGRIADPRRTRPGPAEPHRAGVRCRPRRRRFRAAHSLRNLAMAERERR